MVCFSFAAYSIHTAFLK